MKLFFISLISCTIFVSCEIDKKLIVENTDIPLISKVLIAGESYYEYSYNDANLISEEKSKFHYTKHTYNDSNLLKTSDFYMDPAMFSSSSIIIETAMNRTEWVNPDNTEKSLSKTFEYNSKEQLIRITLSRPSVSNSEYSEFIYENDRISRQTNYWKNEISGYIDYLYDEKGNVIKRIKYMVPSTGIAELITTTEFEYDIMRNPYQSFKRLMDPGKYTNQNNITKEIYTFHFEVDPLTENVHITENSYDYNDKGYPIRVNGEAEYVYK
ncbi:MAG: hypothetical protein EPN88_01260 [Bacteroidetes bacterium]|nr:MAG: hypothetical protein EPN88_01260 [Bacteroidota bacterium]